jgi:hypothetical protein
MYLFSLFEDGIRILAEGTKKSCLCSVLFSGEEYCQQPCFLFDFLPLAAMLQLSCMFPIPSNAAQQIFL